MFQKDIYSSTISKFAVVGSSYGHIVAYTETTISEVFGPLLDMHLAGNCGGYALRLRASEAAVR
jgi:methyl coenzyme M reductase beta subunit